MRKEFLERGPKFLVFEFVFVKRVGPFQSARLGVIELVRSGDEKHARRSEYPAGFGQQRPPADQMFDHLKGRDQIKGRVAKGQGSSGGSQEQACWE